MRKVALVASLVLFSLPAIAETEAAAPAMAAPETAETAPAPALPARLPCETLKARVDAKLQSKGVTSYTLEIMPIEDSSNTTNAAVSGVVASSNPVAKENKGKQVGTCDGGTKRLIYTRGY